MSFQVARWNERLEWFYWSWRRFCHMGWWKQRQEIKYSKEGLLPEDLFNIETKIVCCSTTGSASEDITLPDKAPFLFFAYDSLPCQRVSLSNRKLKKQTLFEIHFVCSRMAYSKESKNWAGKSKRIRNISNHWGWGIWSLVSISCYESRWFHEGW